MTIKFEFSDEEMAGILSLANIGCVYIARNYMNIEDEKEVWNLELDNLEKQAENQVLRLINAEVYDDVLDKIENLRSTWVADLQARQPDKTEESPDDEDEEV